MTVTPDARRAKADELQALHEKYDSWREVQRLHYPKVPAGTLNTIANSEGRNIPKKHWRALGLLQRRKRTDIEKRISKMVRETKKAVFTR